MSNIPKISLSFSKTFEKKKLKVSALGNDHSQIVQENKHTILLFDKNTKPSEPSKPEDSLVIPLIESNRESLYKTLKEKKISSNAENASKDESEMTIDERAAAAVIEESARKLEELQNRSSNETSFRQNMINIPNINETVEEEGVVSSLDDYDQINVQHFGAALLRGMGWSKDQGIGKNKKVIEIIDPTNKGLVLTLKENKKKTNKNEEESDEEEEVKKGCHVLIESGRNRGTYGIIESVDEDHILIRTAREDKVLRDVEQNVKIVSTKEYKDFSRVINKDMYDEYKAAESKKRKEKQKEVDSKSTSKDFKKIKNEHDSKKEENVPQPHINPQRDLTQHKDLKNVKCDKDNDRNSKNQDLSDILKERSKKDYDNDRDFERHNKRERDTEETNYKYKDSYREKSNMEDRNYSSKDLNKEKLNRSKYDKEPRNKDSDGEFSKKRSYEKEPRIESTKNHSRPTIPWARENLKVRIIDKEYKGGKYYKQKVIVSSIDTVESCTCLSEDGGMLYDVNPNNLETVIPKTPSATIMIVKGNYKGQKARILELHKEKEKATIQLLDDRSIILKLYYDDICEYASR